MGSLAAWNEFLPLVDDDKPNDEVFFNGAVTFFEIAGLENPMRAERVKLHNLEKRAKHPSAIAISLAGYGSAPLGIHDAGR